MIKERAGLPYFGFRINDVTSNEIKVTSWGDSPNYAPLQVVFDIMKTSPNISLVIRGSLTRHIAIPLYKSLLDRVEIHHGNPSMDLYSGTNLVLGFNSTCLVEAHMSRISTASLDFCYYKISSISSYLIPLPSSIPRLRNQCQLQKFLQDIIQFS